MKVLGGYIIKVPPVCSVLSTNEMFLYLISVGRPILCSDKTLETLLIFQKIKQKLPSTATKTSRIFYM